MSARNRNPRRRQAFLEEIKAALETVSAKGAQNDYFEVDVRPLTPGFPSSGHGYQTRGYRELIDKVVTDIVHLKPGQTITIKLPSAAEKRTMGAEIQRMRCVEQQDTEAAS